MGVGIYVGMLLLVGSFYDWKYYSLPIWLLILGVIGSAVGILYGLLSGKRSIAEVGLACLPGVVVMLLAYMSREQIGYGDGVFLLIMSGGLGIEQIVTVFMTALTGCCVVSAILLICRKANRNSRLPFVPFLTMGYIIFVLWEV